MSSSSVFLSSGWTDTACIHYEFGKDEWGKRSREGKGEPDVELTCTGAKGPFDFGVDDEDEVVDDDVG